MSNAPRCKWQFKWCVSLFAFLLRLLRMMYCVDFFSCPHCHIFLFSLLLDKLCSPTAAAIPLCHQAPSQPLLISVSSHCSLFFHCSPSAAESIFFSCCLVLPLSCFHFFCLSVFAVCACFFTVFLYISITAMLRFIYHWLNQPFDITYSIPSLYWYYNRFTANHYVQCHSTELVTDPVFSVSVCPLTTRSVDLQARTLFWKENVHQAPTWFHHSSRYWPTLASGCSGD